MTTPTISHTTHIRLNTAQTRAASQTSKKRLGIQTTINELPFSTDGTTF